MDVFLTKYEHESIDFCVKNWKKVASYWLVYPRNIILCWENWRFFAPNRGMTSGGFSWKIEKMSWEHRDFGRMDVFLTKFGYECIVFFRELTFFWQKWVWEEWYFRGKSEKKGIFLIVLAHKIVSFWQNWLLFDQIWAWSIGFLWKIWRKKRHGSAVFFREERFFWQNMGMTAVLFFRELTFFWQNMGIRADIFSWKLVKRACKWLFCPYRVILTELTFVD